MTWCWLCMFFYWTWYFIQPLFIFYPIQICFPYIFYTCLHVHVHVHVRLHVRIHSLHVQDNYMYNMCTTIIFLLIYAWKIKKHLKFLMQLINWSLIIRYKYTNCKSEYNIKHPIKHILHFSYHYQGRSQTSSWGLENFFMIDKFGVWTKKRSSPKIPGVVPQE